jgi:hypothetical protein
MYQAFYGLKGAPFGKELNPRDAFPSHSLKESEARLEYLSRVRGIRWTPLSRHEMRNF